VTLQAGVGLVAIDLRPTPKAAPVTIDSGGGTLAGEFVRRLRAVAPGSPAPLPPVTLSVNLPPGAVSGSHTFQLTPLSPQGLPNLLPLGYSPILAFDFSGSGAPSAMNVHLTGLPAMVVHLVRYDRELHAWTLATSTLEPTAGVLDFPLPGLGTWALMAVDSTVPPLVLPAPGGTLSAAPFATIPEGATSRTLADPPSLPASGGRARGRIEVDSPETLPSGTVVQAFLTETYQLTGGQSATDADRIEDILLYRADLDGVLTPEAGTVALGAELPIVASRQFEASELEEGRVHLRIVSGREGARGVGGSDAVTVSAGGATLSVPSGALPTNTAIALDRAPSISPFVPQPSGFTALAEVVIDLGGATLSTPAELSIPSAGAPPGGTFVVARVESVSDETRLRVVAVAERSSDRVVTRPFAPLPGVTQGGRFVVFHAAPAIGFLAGVTRAAGQPVPALVTTASLPFAGISGSSGAYAVLALAGSVRASARVLGTSLIGTADAQVAAGSVRALDITVSQALTTATITPADGAAAIPVTRQIEVESSAPLDPAFATATSVS
ncbi:MAG: hypothetical protein ACREBE_21370, partial [bacterium]